MSGMAGQTEGEAAAHGALTRGGPHLRIGQRYADIAIGQHAALEREVTRDDLFVFAHASGNLNPLNLPGPEGAEGTRAGAAPAMWLGSLFSALIGNILPGPGTVYAAQSLRFLGRAHVGERLRVQVSVIEKHQPNLVVLKTEIWRGGDLLADGRAEVHPPREGVTAASSLPALSIQTHPHAQRLLAACTRLPPMVCAVAVPEEEEALRGALLAAAAGLITPILVGSQARITALAARIGADLHGIAIEDQDDPDAAAAQAVALVRQGRAASVMKGHLHTDQLLHHVVKRDGGLRGTRRLSHVFVMDVPSLGDLLLVTDAAINIAPDLEAKADIVQNAIDLARALGLAMPRAGILAAVETVSAKMPATIDAAALSKMAERGQITGGRVDGPLAMDNAIDLHAARLKGIYSPVAGRADILVAPNLEAGNILAKQLSFVAGAQAAGIVLGASAPVLLTSRSDDAQARLFSAAIARLYAHWQAEGTSAVAAWDNPDAPGAPPQAGGG